MTTKKHKEQLVISFDWRRPIKNRPVLLKPYNKLSNWPNEWIQAYISSWGNRLSYKGGKLAIYKSSRYANSGYMLINGYDELNELFEVKY